MAQIGKDLAKVRKQQGMSLEQVHASSRIPVRILESIEDGSIFTDLTTNNTMIRSNVRSFARVLKLDDDSVIAVLNDLEQGKDSPLLAISADSAEQDEAVIEDEQDVQNNSEDTPQPKQEQEQEVEAEVPKSSPKKRGRPRKTSSVASSNQDLTQQKEEEEKKLAEESVKAVPTTDSEDIRETEVESEQEATVSAKTPKEEAIEENKATHSAEISNSMFNKDLNEVDWERLNKRKDLKRPGNGVSYIGVLLSIIVITVVVLYFTGFFDFMFNSSTDEAQNTVETPTEEGQRPWLNDGGNSETNAEDVTDQVAENFTSEVPSDAEVIDVEEPDVTADNTQQNVESPQSTTDEEAIQQAESSNETEDVAQEAEEDVVSEVDRDPYSFIDEQAVDLPQQLEILVYAASNNLAPVRVQWDGIDQLRPYWVEVGQAMRVTFQNELKLRTLDYDRMILIFNGHPIGNIYAQFYNEEEGVVIIPRSFFEARATAFITPADTENGFLGESAPSRIYDRPTF